MLAYDYQRLEYVALSGHQKKCVLRARCYAGDADDQDIGRNSIELPQSTLR